MKGYIKRNASGVKEIREGDVMPERKLNYDQRHTMSSLDWQYYWNGKMSWEVAKIIKIHPGLYWAFPEEGKIEFAQYSGYAIPTNIAPIILEPSYKHIDIHRMHRKMERFLYPEDGGYQARRNAKDGGL